MIVVGAGPGGSAAAYALATQGLSVALLEKTAFPREKVCGDGLTPRAVKQLIAMGIDLSGPDWIRNKGLRIVAGEHRLHLPWPELADFPNFGLVRSREDFDEILAQRAVAVGVDLFEQTPVSGPILDERTGRIIGVQARRKSPGDRKGEPVEFHAPLVVAADGNASRLSLAMGIHKRDDRPMGVAVRTYYKTPYDKDDWMEAWLELRDGDNLLPGYGWIFGMGDGTANVGLGILDSSPVFGQIDNRELLRRWLKNIPEERGLVEENRVGPVRGAALPMAFNRKPHYERGLVLVGDSGGMVNPFNGEGIAYAMEAGAIAGEVIAQALARPSFAARELAMSEYPRILDQNYGGYYTLGRYFVNIIGHPEVMRIATTYGLRYRQLMRLTVKLMANLTDSRGGDSFDRLINTMSKVVPTA